MAKLEIPRAELGRTEAFLSYNSLKGINVIDPQRQFKYAHEGTYTSSATFHNRALMFGIGEKSARAICEELKSKGYIGLIEIEIINPKQGVSQIRGRPIVPVTLEKGVWE